MKNNNGVQVGQIWQADIGGQKVDFKVMAVVDGYVMYRKARCMPAVKGVSDFMQLYQLQE